MTFFPGREGVVDDVLHVAALAQAAFVSPSNFVTLPYVRDLLGEAANRALIERVLTMSVKLRFLDDRAGRRLLTQDQARLYLVGKLSVGDDQEDKPLKLREALNKLIHHEHIEAATEDRRSFVIPFSDPPPERELKTIPIGQHISSRVVIRAHGHNQDSTPWTCEIDLFSLLNEVLLALET